MGHWGRPETGTCIFKTCKQAAAEPLVGMPAADWANVHILHDSVIQKKSKTLKQMNLKAKEKAYTLLICSLQIQTLLTRNEAN